MPNFDVDLLVIGGGSGGVRAARLAAQRGMRVALAEAADLGGTCVNVGCIPKKLYSYAAHYAEAAAEARGYGWRGAARTLDWDLLKQRRVAEVVRLQGVYRHLLTAAGVQLLQGWARLVDGHTVALGSQRITARNIVLATGGTPRPAGIPGEDLAVSSDQMFDLQPFPKRLAIVGGGYIACEFASIFNALGAEVTLLQRAGGLLTGFDADVSQFIASEMGKAGVDVRLNCQVAAVTRSGKALAITTEGGAEIAADTVLLAIGRRPNTQDMGLEQAGVELDERGAVVVDANFRSSVASIHAVGDVSTRRALTPVAIAEAARLVEHLYGEAAATAPASIDFDFLPTAVFTHPAIATVGWTEAEARKRIESVSVFRTDFRSLKHSLSGRNERTLMKLVVDAATDRVVGLHMVGADAGEIVQGFAVALRAGATKALFDSTVGIHPTVAEEFLTLRDPVPNE